MKHIQSKWFMTYTASNWKTLHYHKYSFQKDQYQNRVNNHIYAKEYRDNFLIQNALENIIYLNYLNGLQYIYQRGIHPLYFLRATWRRNQGENN